MEDEDDETTRLLRLPGDLNTRKDSLRRHSSAHLPPFHEQYEPSESPSSAITIWTVVPILLLGMECADCLTRTLTGDQGVFIANADASLVVASSQHIASEFHAMSNASWLITSYGLAQCASQPLVGTRLPPQDFITEIAESMESSAISSAASIISLPRISSSLLAVSYGKCFEA